MDRLRPSDPENIGPYKLIARLGAGGMGVVFLGTKGTDRAAIKVVRNSFLDDPSLKTRFVREIETLKKINSPFVAKIVDSSMEEELSWHAVEFVNGPTLRELVDSNGPLAQEAWWELAHQLGEGLAAVHRLGIVHRDIKPANIIMSDTGPKIIDFGISQDSDATSLTMTGTVAGSPAWLSPEQLEGIAVTAGSDLYSLGSVLVFAATGQSPWGSETSMSIPAIHQKILTGQKNLEGLAVSQRELIKDLQNPNPSKRQFPVTGLPVGSEASESSQNPVPTKQPVAVEEPAAFDEKQRSPGIAANSYEPADSSLKKRRVRIGIAALSLLGFIALMSFAGSRVAHNTSVSSVADNVAIDVSATGPPVFEYWKTVNLLVQDGPAAAENSLYNYVVRHFFEQPDSGRLMVFGWRQFGDRFSDRHILEPDHYDYLNGVPSLPMSFESISPDGKLGGFYDDDLGSCVLVDLKTFTPTAEFEEAGSSYDGCVSTFSPDGKRFYFRQWSTVDDVSVDLFVRVLNLETGLEETPIVASPQPREIVVSDDYLVVKQSGLGSEQDFLRVIRLDDQSVAAEIELEHFLDGDLQMSPDGSSMYFLSHGGDLGGGNFAGLRMLDLKTMEVSELSPTMRGPYKLAISGDGRLVGWLDRGQVSLFDTKNKVRLDPISVEYPHRIGLSKDGKKLFIGLWEPSPEVLIYTLAGSLD